MGAKSRFESADAMVVNSTWESNALDTSVDFRIDTQVFLHGLGKIADACQVEQIRMKGGQGEEIQEFNSLLMVMHVRINTAQKHSFSLVSR
jgi:hypothetical protein